MLEKVITANCVGTQNNVTSWLTALVILVKLSLPMLPDVSRANRIERRRHLLDCRGWGSGKTRNEGNGNGTETETETERKQNGNGNGNGNGDGNGNGN